ncbi:MAG: acyl carrier protein [Euryarchaeota archaeon]|nr:acyl carrier protein [Euryarchaeota archaeon]
MKADPRSWLLAWFAGHAKIDQDNIKPDTNYIERGLLDSFAFIALISDVEQEFRIRFSDGDFRKTDFLTISGLASIIERKMK